MKDYFSFRQDMVNGLTDINQLVLKTGILYFLLIY